MSLKTFHIAFIAISAVIAGVFALWCAREISRSPEPFTIAGAIGAALAMAGLAIYGAHFLKRARNIDYL